VLCAPNIPLLFMGEEYGETAPFLYFTSHTDLVLARAVSEGRRREFIKFAWGEEIPDPQIPETFCRSVLQHQLRDRGTHQALLGFYSRLIALRKSCPALRNCSKEYLAVITPSAQPVLVVHRWHPHAEQVLLLASFASHAISENLSLPQGRWQKILDADAAQFGGTEQERLPLILSSPGVSLLEFVPFAFALYRAEATVSP
jgi:maltooligosyltrehalose trehalohydrolase